MEAHLQVWRILFLIFITSIFVSSISFAPTIYMKEDLSRRDKLCLDYTLGQIEADSVLSCAHRCQMTEDCMSMFYNSQTNQCVLDRFIGAYLDSQPPEIMTVSQGWQYYEIVDGFLSQRRHDCLQSGFLYDSVVNVCYKITSEVYLDFNVMKQQCANMSSKLIKITSQEKQDWIVSALATITEKRVCIQGNNDNPGLVYQFDDGTAMTYFNWNTFKGQPGGENDHYLYMSREFNFLWHDSENNAKDCIIVCEK